jgi:hypothetical protein
VNRYYFPRILLSLPAASLVIPRQSLLPLSTPGYLWSCRLRAVSAPRPDTCGDGSASSCGFPYLLYLNITAWLAWSWAPFRSLLAWLLPNERVGQSHQPSTALRSTASRARSALILVGVPVLVPPSRHPVSICDKVLHVKGHASNHGLFSVIQRYSLIWLDRTESQYSFGDIYYLILIFDTHLLITR